MASFLELIKTKYLCDLNQEVFQLVLFILNPRIFLAPVSPLFHGLLIPDVCVFYKRVCFFFKCVWPSGNKAGTVKKKQKTT